MALQLHPVILCGGSGTRLWPLSRQARPKQFLALAEGKSLLQETFARVAAMQECGAPLVLCNQEHRFMVAEQLQESGVRPAAQLLEPAARNTAPAIAVAALHLQERDPGALMLVLPSDHVILDRAAFADAARDAAAIAAGGSLVTFGIKPSGPNTGYGYIEQGEPITGGPRAWRIARFVEKPDLETARGYVASGRFFWNSGMFVLPARRYVEELEKLNPAVVKAARDALTGAQRDLDFVRLEAKAFERSPAISIDYAVMEKTKAGAVVAGDFGWSDVGSWSALWDIGAKDAQGNVARGDVHVRGAERCYLWSDGRLVVALGVEDLVVVETEDAVLVAKRARAEEVKDVVRELEDQQRREPVSHTRVHRPWGYFDSVDGGERFQVKRIVVMPGQALSLQMHRQRAEHWVVVSGTARVTRDDKVYEVKENESTFIPLGAKHRLENAGSAPLHIIEVQSGSYLGEDDIVRFEDRYRRS